MTSTFIFYADDYNDEIQLSSFCKIQVTVTEKTYNGNTFYYINYVNKYGGNKQLQKLHPLYDRESSLDGEIIVKNSLTEQLIKYLLMDFEELSKYSGNSSPIHYKKCIMRIISELWD